MLQHWEPWRLLKMAICSGADPPLPNGKATCNQWTFEVHSLQSKSSGRALFEHLMVMQSIWPGSWVPLLFIKAILDKLDSLYSLVCTFDIMMEEFYRESQRRSESAVYYVMRLEGKLNET